MAATRDEDVTRREFLGSATLTAAGVATGLSFYFSRPEKRSVGEFNTPENQVRLGYIGVGNRGGSLMRSSLQVPGCVPVAVADVRPGQRKAYAKRAGEETDFKQPKDYGDYRRILDDKSIEAVIIATPHHLHGAMALDALEAGKHVYCEKAMAFTIGENQDIYNLVGRLNEPKASRVFQVGHQRRYSPLYQKVARMVQDDQIGDVAALRAQWNQNQVEKRSDPDPTLNKLINWRLYSEFSGGLTTEFASHQVDVVNWMLGTHPDSVCGYGGVDWYQDGRDTDDNIHLIFNYKMPVVEREYGEVKKDESGAPVYKRTEDGRIAHRNVRFTYMSMMQNAHLGPSELILGTKGSIDVCLSGGGEYFIEPKALQEAQRRVADEAGEAGAGKKAVKSGATIASSCLVRKKGERIEPEKDTGHWVHYTTPIQGAYDTGETFLAIGSFLDSIRKARTGQDFTQELKANAEVGLWGAVPCLMANLAMQEGRTVYWSEFFPEDEAVG